MKREPYRQANVKPAAEQEALLSLAGAVQAATLDPLTADAVAEAGSGMQIGIDRVKERLKALGKTGAGASLEAGLNKDAIRNILNGRSRNARVDTMSQLATVLETTIPYLMGETDDSSPLADGASKRWLVVKHAVGAGFWRESDDAPASGRVESAPVPVTEDNRYRGMAQWLEQVIGDSAGQRFPAGSYVHVVETPGYQPRVGDYVIVRRLLSDLIERSIRRVAQSAAGFELVKPPNDPELMGPVNYPALGVEINGRLIGSYSSVD